MFLFVCLFCLNVVMINAVPFFHAVICVALCLLAARRRDRGLQPQGHFQHQERNRDKNSPQVLRHLRVSASRDTCPSGTCYTSVHSSVGQMFLVCRSVGPPIRRRSVVKLIRPGTWNCLLRFLSECEEGYLFFTFHNIPDGSRSGSSR